jgi:hypothetical protein
MADGANKDERHWLYKTSLYDEDAKEANVCAGAYTAYETLTNPTDYSGLFSSCANLFAKQGIDPLFSSVRYHADRSRYWTILLANWTFLSPAQYRRERFHERLRKIQRVRELRRTPSSSGVGFSSALADELRFRDGPIQSQRRRRFIGKASPKLIRPDTKGYVFSAVEYGPQKFVFQSHLEAAGLGDLKPVDLSSLDPSTAGKPSRPLHQRSRYLPSKPISSAMSDENFAGAKAQILYNEIKAYLPCNPRRGRHPPSATIRPISRQERDS